MFLGEVSWRLWLLRSPIPLGWAGKIASCTLALGFQWQCSSRWFHHPVVGTKLPVQGWEMLGELEKRRKKNYIHKYPCTWHVWGTALQLTVHRRIKRLRSHSWRWLWSLWSQFQHSYAPVLCSILCLCWGDYQDGGHLDRWGRCEVGEGVVVHFSLPSVPLKCEVLNRSNVLDITEQLVFLPFNHGPRVVNRPDGDAIGCFCEKMTQT